MTFWPETGLTIYILLWNWHISLHLIMMNFHTIEENKIIFYKNTSLIKMLNELFYLAETNLNFT